jgi:hypothetical protein
MSTFKVKIEGNRVIVEASVPEYDPRRAPREKVDTSDVENYLLKEGIEFPPCIQHSSLNNRDPDALSGVWVFANYSMPAPQTPGGPADTGDTAIFEKKTIKPLDKPAEKVILTKENKPAPKKRKSRAKKKTTK